MQELLARFAIDAVAVLIIIHGLYYTRSRRADYYFTFAVIALATFFMVSLLGSSTMGTGFALGLFAIFSIIRYRTELMPVREMTYLFALIAISVINALASVYGYLGLIAVNAVFIAVIALGEMLRRHVSVTACKYVKYDRIDLITPQRRTELIADLEERLGLKVVRVEVGSVNFLKDMTLLKVYYTASSDNEENSVDEIFKLKD